MGRHTIESIEALNRILEEEIVETVNHRLLTSLVQNYLDVDKLNNTWCMQAPVDTLNFEPEHKHENEAGNIRTWNQTVSDMSEIPPRLPPRPLPSPRKTSNPAEDVRRKQSTISLGSIDLNEILSEDVARSETSTPKPTRRTSENVLEVPPLPPKPQKPVNEPAEPVAVRSPAPSKNRSIGNRLKAIRSIIAMPPSKPNTPVRDYEDHTPRVAPHLTKPPLQETECIYEEIKPRESNNHSSSTVPEIPVRFSSGVGAKSPLSAVVWEERVAGIPKNHHAISKQLHEELKWKIHTNKLSVPSPVTETYEEPTNIVKDNPRKHGSTDVLPKGRPVTSIETPNGYPRGRHSTTRSSSPYYSAVCESSYDPPRKSMPNNAPREEVDRNPATEAYYDSPDMIYHDPDENVSSHAGQSGYFYPPRKSYHAPNENEVRKPGLEEYYDTPDEIYHDPNENKVCEPGLEEYYDTPDKIYHDPKENVDCESELEGCYDTSDKIYHDPNEDVDLHQGVHGYNNLPGSNFHDPAEMINYDPIEYWNTVSTASDPCSWLTEEPLYQLTEAYEYLHREDPTVDIYERYDVNTFRPSIKEQRQIHSHQAKGRTLWCQVESVIGANVLDGLSRREKDVYEAKFEIYTTEVSFLKSLKILKKHFIKSREFSDLKTLSKRDGAELFMYIKPLMATSKAFLRDLDDCWKKSIFMHGIFDVICKHASKNFGIYVTYCSYLNDTIEKLRSLCGGKSFSKALRDLENSEVCSKLSLLSFLTLPMERITSMDLLIKKALSSLVKEDKAHDTHEYNTEHDSCLLASDYVIKVCEKSNEACKTKRRIKNLMQLDTKLKYPGNVSQLSLISGKRWLIMFGDVEKLDWTPSGRLKKQNAIVRSLSSASLISESCTIFLFNDYVILAKKTKSDGSGLMVVDYCPRHHTKIVLPSDMQHMQKTNAKDMMDSTKQYKMILVMNENHEKKKVEMMLSCSLENERNHWVKSIPEQQMKEISPEPTPKAYVCVYPFSSEEENELSLVKGEEVTVTKKLSDGWLEGTRSRDMRRGTFPPSRVKEVSPPSRDPVYYYSELFTF